MLIRKERRKISRETSLVSSEHCRAKQTHDEQQERIWETGTLAAVQPALEVATKQGTGTEALVSFILELQGRTDENLAKRSLANSSRIAVSGNHARNRNAILLVAFKITSTEISELSEESDKTEGELLNSSDRESYLKPEAVASV